MRNVRKNGRAHRPRSAIRAQRSGAPHIHTKTQNQLPPLNANYKRLGNKNGKLGATHTKGKRVKPLVIGVLISPATLLSSILHVNTYFRRQRKKMTADARRSEFQRQKKGPVDNSTSPIKGMMLLDLRCYRAKRVIPAAR